MLSERARGVEWETLGVTSVTIFWPNFKVFGKRFKEFMQHTDTCLLWLFASHWANFDHRNSDILIFVCASGHTERDR